MGRRKSILVMGFMVFEKRTYLLYDRNGVYHAANVLVKGEEGDLDFYRRSLREEVSDLLGQDMDFRDFGRSLVECEGFKMKIPAYAFMSRLPRGRSKFNGNDIVNKLNMEDLSEQVKPFFLRLKVHSSIERYCSYS